MNSCTRFCVDCPIVPKGLIVEAVNARQINFKNRAEFSGAGDEKLVRRLKANRERDKIEIEVRVVSSTQREIPVGTTTTLQVYGEGRGPRGVIAAIARCQKPRAGILTGRLSVKKVCGCLNNDFD